MLTNHRTTDLTFNVNAEQHFVTYHLADALSLEMLKELQQLPKYAQQNQVETMLDQGHGRCILKHPKIAQILLDSWNFFDHERYDIIAYVIMPNHAHVLVRLYAGETISKIVLGWQAFTASQISITLNELKESPMNPIWKSQFWNTLVEDEEDFDEMMTYILKNPIKAHLAETPEKYPWCSAYKKY